MEDAPVSKHLPAREEVATAVAVPAMPQPREDTLWRTPYMVQDDLQSLRYAIGWQDSKKDGRCFVVARASTFGGEKVLDRFPLTADGWARAWATLVKADAAVVFSDGTGHTTALDGNYAVLEAQKQVVQFNALAGATAPPAAKTGSNHADGLRTLQELLDAGLLTHEEYEAKRAEIIKSI